MHAGTQVRRYIGNGVGSDWFSEKLTLPNRVTGACRAWKWEEEERELSMGCSEIKRRRNMMPPPGTVRERVNRKKNRREKERKNKIVG
jgi:hypothetical protein